jgi:DNA-binding beta-propeller fold protein YncE
MLQIVYRAMLRTQSCALALALAIATSARAQDSCNAPAKDAIVHLAMPGSPFEPVITADGCWLFVTLAGGNNGTGQGQIAVVHRDAGRLTVVRTVPIKGGPAGAVLTHDGKMLVVADGGYIAFLDAARLISGAGDPVLGYIGSGSTIGFINVNVTADDKVLFAAAERAQAVVVVNLDQVRAGKISDDAVVSKLDVGNAPIAVTLSPDGRYLYTTSEASLPNWKWAEVCEPENAAAAGRGRAGGRGRVPPPEHGQGAIIVFDAALALTDPAHAAVSRVAAGCGTVRLVLSADGNTAYVTARADNTLLAFDAHRLVTDAAHALLGKVEVGVAPVGIAVVDSGAGVVVTNSNRFAGNGGDQQPLTVVDAAKLRAGGKKSVLGEIQAGGFPREMRVSLDARTLFVTNFTSMTLEMIDLSRALPKAH